MQSALTAPGCGLAFCHVLWNPPAPVSKVQIRGQSASPWSTWNFSTSALRHGVGRAALYAGRSGELQACVSLGLCLLGASGTSKSFFFFFNFLIVFIYFWLCWVFIAACPFLWLQHRGSSLWGVSCQGARVLRQAGSAVAAHMTSCSAASGIFWMDQGSNLCPLHWQAGS